MSRQPLLIASFERQLDRLSKEFNISVCKEKPSILLAVYENTFLGAKAVSGLEARLKKQGQYICHITPDIKGKNNIIAEITPNNYQYETVFFIMHLGNSKEENIYNTLNVRTDFFIKHQIRVIYWLTKQDLIAYVKNVPKQWFSKHKIINFSSSGWENILPSVIRHIGKKSDGIEADQVRKLEDIPLTELLSLDICNGLSGLVERDDEPAEEIVTSMPIQTMTNALQRKSPKHAFWIAIELDPSNGRSYYNLALENTINGLYKDAIPLYKKSIRLFAKRKDKALSWNQLGNVYRRLNEPSLAVAAYENARVLDPFPKSSIVSRARLSLMGNCYAE